VSLEIVVGTGTGQIDGVVLDKDDQVAAGATVVLAPPPALRDRAYAFQETTADQYGRFQFKSAAPGEARLFAWDEIEEESWRAAAVLRSFEAQSEPIHVESQGHHVAKLHLAR
jgi:hypothetical protein